MFGRGRRREEDLERELRAHLELEAEEQRENGLSPEEARHAAQRAFGSVAQVSERVREAWGRGWLDEVQRDLRFALRLVGRNRGFAAGAAIPLAFAIGCTACALTLVDAVLFRPLGMRDPDRLAAVYSFSRQKNTFASVDYADFRDLQSLGVVESAAAFVRFPVNVRFSAGTERMNAELVAGDYFRTAGVQPAAGRAFHAGDLSPGAAPVALVSYALWESRYGRSASLLGSTVWLDGVAFTVIGVMPRGYGGTLLDWYASPSFWIPLARIREMLPPFRTLDYENRRDMRWLMAIARLRPGAAPAQLQAALTTLASQAAEDRRSRLVALAADEARFFPGRRAATLRILWLLAGVSAAALAIACFNLANLLLARTAVRQKEIGARLALGAGWRRLTQQFVIENAVLAACACAWGLPMALGTTSAAGAVEAAFGLTVDLSANWRALAVSALAGFLTAAAAGLAPAWRCSRISLAGAMKSASPGAIAGVRRISLRDAFVAAQVACAMAALVPAVVLARSLHRWESLPLGYATNGVLIGELDSLSAKLPEAEQERTYRALLSEVRLQARGAALAAFALPARGQALVDIAADDAGQSWTPVSCNDVSDGYFELLRIAVIRGRAFLPADDRRSRRVIILNQSAAALFFPGSDAVGRRVRLRGEAGPREVVGVVADSRYRPLGEDQPAHPFAFLPLMQQLPKVVTIHARAPGEAAGFAGDLRRIVARTAPEMPLTGVQPLARAVRAGLAQVSLVSGAVGAVCAAGVALALTGIMAGVAYNAAQRKHEIAVRIAVGDEPGRVARIFARRGTAIGLAGAAAGLLPAMWLARVLAGSLRGVDPPEAWLLAASGLTLAAVAGVVSWTVARRASRLQPAAVLRVQ